jgi:TonB family protein
MLRRCLYGLLATTWLAWGFQPVDEPPPQPRVLHRVEPHYTPEARRKLIQGTVLVEVVVDERGKPAAVSVLSPLGFGLDDHAVEAVSHWTFGPAMDHGKPVRATSIVEVNFRIFHHWFDPSREERRTSFNLAVDEIQRNRRTEQTSDVIRNLALQKYPPAMYLYAKMLEAGDGFERDPNLAFLIILEAAAKHYPAAMFETGRRMIEGRRLPKDQEKGLELVRNAAILRNRPAQFYLGTAYANGEIVPRDPDRAIQYFRLCAGAGETPCQVQFAKLLLDRPDRQERDLVQAVAWLQLAAERENAEARLILDQQHIALSAKEVSWVNKIKPQLMQTP